MMIKFIYCKNFATAEELEVEWDKFTYTVTRSIEFPSKEASKRRGAFIGGTLIDPNRNRADNNIAQRTSVTMDFDAVKLPLGDIEPCLRLQLDCAFVAYSTFRHTDAAPRIRLCVPLSRAVSQSEHKAIVDRLAFLLEDLGAPDKCSWVWAQLMFLASHQPGVKPWSVVQEGEAWQVSDVLEGVEYTVDNPTPERGELSTGNDQLPWTTEQSSDNLRGNYPQDQTQFPVRPTVGGDDFGSGDIADLERAIASRPLDLSDDQVAAILEKWPAEDKEYDEWLEVGMALFHQYEGSAGGYKRWLAWSAKSAKHDPREMRAKWASFGGRPRPKTFASIIKKSGGLARAAEIEPAGDTFAALEAQAGAVTDLKAYVDLRDRVRKLSDSALPLAMRVALAQAAFESFGKQGGLTKAEVKRDFRPARRKGPGGVGEQSGPGGVDTFSGPDWLSDWVFCQADSTFERVSVRHSIRRDAFRITYDAMPDVVAAETDAVTFARKICNLPIVANLMFWPGGGQFFEHRGLIYLNTYEESGVTPCETLEGDEDGRAVVELFLQHIRNLIPSEREQRIVIDFLAYVYQNPGKRIRWAMLLYGIEGAGKTYLFKVAQLLMGHNAKTVSTTAINSEFTGWADNARLINIDEIRIAGTNKYGMLDKMKPMISDDTISVIYKGKDERSIPNFASYIMSTNHADAIPVSDSDRRYCVLTTRYTTKEELTAFHGGPEGVAAYFKRLFSETARRADAIACFLRDWEVDACFDPDGRAPETDGLLSMRSLNVSEERDEVEAAIDHYASPIISRDLLDVTELNKVTMMDGKSLPSRKQLGHILSNLGLQQIEGRRIKLKDRTDHYVWFNRNRHTDEEARRLVREYHDGDRDFSDVPF